MLPISVFSHFPSSHLHCHLLPSLLRTASGFVSRWPDQAHEMLQIAEMMQRRDYAKSRDLITQMMQGRDYANCTT